MAPHRDSKTLRVRDVFNLDTSSATIVRRHVPFVDVVRAFASGEDLRGIFVVDNRDRLAGVITRQDLLHWAAHHLSISDPAGWDWREIHRVVSATTAIEACRKGSNKCHVDVDDPLRDAMALMLENELIDIPVLDADGKILGDLRLTEILAKVFEQAAKA